MKAKIMADFLIFVGGIFIILILLSAVFGKGIIFSVLGFVAEAEPAYLQEEIAGFLTAAANSPGEFKAGLKVRGADHLIVVDYDINKKMGEVQVTPFNSIYTIPSPRYFSTGNCIIKASPQDKDNWTEGNADEWANHGGNPNGYSNYATSKVGTKAIKFAFTNAKYYWARYPKKDMSLNIDITKYNNINFWAYISTGKINYIRLTDRDNHYANLSRNLNIPLSQWTKVTINLDDFSYGSDFDKTNVKWFGLSHQTSTEHTGYWLIDGLYFSNPKVKLNPKKTEIIYAIKKYEGDSCVLGIGSEVFI